jgi:universal stress protein F
MFKSILVPVDIMHESSWRHALPQAIAMAKADNARVTLMTVIREATAMFEGVYLEFQLERMMSDARKKLARIAQQQATPDVAIALDVRVGSISGEIISGIAEHGADLIVMQSHRPEMKDYIIGPNAAHVVMTSSSSVLVLRHTGV